MISCEKTTRAYLGGTFDLLHVGHARFFEWAYYRFDRVIVAVNTDAFVSRYKKPPAQTYEERAEMVASCRWVHEVVCNVGDEDSKPAIREARPTHIVNGSDWSRERLLLQMGLTEQFLALANIRIALCPLERIFSTTELKERIRKP